MVMLLVLPGLLAAWPEWAQDSAIEPRAVRLSATTAFASHANADTLMPPEAWLPVSRIGASDKRSNVPDRIPETEDEVVLPAAAAAIFGATVLGGLGAILGGKRYEPAARLARRWRVDPAVRDLRRAAAEGDAAGFRRAFGAAMRARGGDPRQAPSLARLDDGILNHKDPVPDLRELLPEALRDLGRAARGGP